MTMHHPSFSAVLFDCDGVLADSEAITNQIMCDMFAESGWHITLAQCMALFVGKTLRDEAALIEHHTGRPLTQAWLQDFAKRRNAALAAQLQPVAGIQTAVPAIHAAFGGRIACASGADLIKVELQLRKIDLWPYFEGRVLSGHDQPRNKPAPDVYLAAAARLGVPPTDCAVVEDTPTGVAAGAAAGANVFGYAPHDRGESLLAAGAGHVFHRMEDLPSLLPAAKR